MSSNTGRRVACFALMLAAELVFSPAASSQPVLMPNGPPWKVKPVFEKTDKVREAISGAACAPTLPPTCLAVNDEENYAQFFSVKGRKIDPSRLMRLMPSKGNGIEFGSLTAEAAAYELGFFYV